jgi:hypothetical protein
MVLDIYLLIVFDNYYKVLNINIYKLEYFKKNHINILLLLTL